MEYLITMMYITYGFMDGLLVTMASPIQLSLPAFEISSIYNPFYSRFLFPVAFHRCNVYRSNGLHTIRPFTTWRPCTCAKELAFIRIKLFLHYKRLLANDKLFIKAITLQ